MEIIDLISPLIWFNFIGKRCYVRKSYLWYTNEIIIFSALENCDRSTAIEQYLQLHSRFWREKYVIQSFHCMTLVITEKRLQQAWRGKWIWKCSSTNESPRVNSCNATANVSFPHIYIFMNANHLYKMYIVIILYSLCFRNYLEDLEPPLEGKSHSRSR